MNLGYSGLIKSSISIPPADGSDCAAAVAAAAAAAGATIAALESNFNNRVVKVHLKPKSEYISAMEGGERAGRSMACSSSLYVRRPSGYATAHRMCSQDCERNE